ncbi:histidine--tRNA ligase [candidate division WWE3 bacterium]|uniref:Histidine--tRNA ligase n=1 Tax=candidate division WWE3 bacterium TaxID=2053526 RepID=A0A7X9DKP0_UNCKA|nr:histidine--tRNA ligase [candidate division WWE3 bacterium]
MIEPSILPGFMELLPGDQIAFNKFLKKIQESYELFGFLPIDTPVIEKAEILMAKGGEETEKQTYAFTKGDNELALRFDLTVPLARYVSQRQNELYFPFKRYQIGKVYRGEKPQKGRFREFYQCDADVVARDILPLNYDAELVSLIYFTFKKLAIGDFVVRISNRKILTGLLEELGLKSTGGQILRLADKKDKMSPERFLAELSELVANQEKVDQIIEFLNFNGSPEESIHYLESRKFKSELFNTGLSELEEVVNTVRQLKVPDTNWRVDFKIIRGLDYYTGTVYETTLVEYPQLGSVCGGGRYEDLAAYYTDQKLPGVGISIGLTRFFSQLKEIGAINSNIKTTTQVLISPMTENILPKANSLASVLRQNGIRTEVFSQQSTLKKQLDYANKQGINFVAIIGEDEITSETVTIKDMGTSDQQTIALVDLLDYLIPKI